MKASTETLFAEHIDQGPPFFFFLVASSSVCWKEKGIHLDRSTICILIIAQLRSGRQGCRCGSRLCFLDPCHAHHPLTSTTSPEFRILSLGRAVTIPAHSCDWLCVWWPSPLLRWMRRDGEAGIQDGVTGLGESLWSIQAPWSFTSKGRA